MKVASSALWVLLQNRLATLDPSQSLGFGPLPLTVPRVAWVLEQASNRAVEEALYVSEAERVVFGAASIFLRAGRKPERSGATDENNN